MPKQRLWAFTSLLLVLLMSTVARAATTFDIKAIDFSCSVRTCTGGYALMQQGTTFTNIAPSSPSPTLPAITLLDSSDMASINTVTATVTAQLAAQNAQFTSFQSTLLGALNGAVDDRFNADAQAHDAALVVKVEQKLVNDPVFLSNLAKALLVASPKPPGAAQSPR